MSMPEFISNVEHGAKQPGWLTPATVADLSDGDFVTLSPGQRKELRRAVERFQAIAGSGSRPTPAEEAGARAALDTILDLLQPYLTPESRTVREAIWRAWRDEHARDWMPTFDYELGEDWTGDPAIRIWLILNDDVDVEADDTREKLSRLRTLIRKELRATGVGRWPYTSVWTLSDAKDHSVRTTA